MKTLKFKKSRILPYLSQNDNKKIFLAINIAFIIGGLSLVSTFLFLLKNINKADEILWFCLPGFCFGIVLIILYSIGYQRLLSANQQTEENKIISFRR